jgi:hypothetical protein
MSTTAFPKTTSFPMTTPITTSFPMTTPITTPITTPMPNAQRYVISVTNPTTYQTCNSNPNTPYYVNVPSQILYLAVSYDGVSVTQSINPNDPYSQWVGPYCQNVQTGRYLATDGPYSIITTTSPYGNWFTTIPTSNVSQSSYVWGSSSMMQDTTYLGGVPYTGYLTVNSISGNITSIVKDIGRVYYNVGNKYSFDFLADTYHYHNGIDYYYTVSIAPSISIPPAPVFEALVNYNGIYTISINSYGVKLYAFCSSDGPLITWNTVDTSNQSDLDIIKFTGGSYIQHVATGKYLTGNLAPNGPALIASSKIPSVIPSRNPVDFFAGRTYSQLSTPITRAIQSGTNVVLPLTGNTSIVDGFINNRYFGQITSWARDGHGLNMWNTALQGPYTPGIGVPPCPVISTYQNLIFDVVPPFTPTTPPPTTIPPTTIPPTTTIRPTTTKIVLPTAPPGVRVYTISDGNGNYLTANPSALAVGTGYGNCSVGKDPSSPYAQWYGTNAQNVGTGQYLSTAPSNLNMTITPSNFSTWYIAPPSVRKILITSITAFPVKAPVYGAAIGAQWYLTGGSAGFNIASSTNASTLTVNTYPPTVGAPISFIENSSSSSSNSTNVPLIVGVSAGAVLLIIILCLLLL